jgi:hypothetical protein
MHVTQLRVGVPGLELKPLVQLKLWIVNFCRSDVQQTQPSL